jgi:hypothetical protein
MHRLVGQTLGCFPRIFVKAPVEPLMTEIITTTKIEGK